MAKKVEVKAHIVPRYEANTDSYYSNYFRFRQTQNECLLEFGRVCFPSFETDDEVPEALEVDALMQGQIWLTHEVARQLHDLLGRQLEDDEAGDGEGEDG